MASDLDHLRACIRQAEGSVVSWRDFIARCDKDAEFGKCLLCDRERDLARLRADLAKAEQEAETEAIEETPDAPH